MNGSLIGLFRLMPWLLGSLLCVAAVAYVAPHQIAILVWSLSKLCLGAYLGYWIDRSVFYYSRPGDILVSRIKSMEMATLIAASMLRRALIIAAAILALGLGV